VIRPALLALTLLAAGCTCEASHGRPPQPGFETEDISLCTSGTAAASVRTRNGGRLELQILDACRRVLRSCAPLDVFAANAVASVRISGSELLAEGCVLSAADGSYLRAVFVPRDASASDLEHWDTSIRGCSDAATTDAACPVDAGAIRDAARD
jgi:hypothetical protein